MVSAITRPWRCALSESWVPSVMSPAAKMLGTLVRMCSSVTICPFFSIFTPTSSRPMPRVFSVRPMATSTSSEKSSSPLASVLFTLPSGCTSTAAMPLPHFTLTPRFSSEALTASVISVSCSAGTRFGIISTMVTSTP